MLHAKFVVILIPESSTRLEVSNFHSSLMILLSQTAMDSTMSRIFGKRQFIKHIVSSFYLIF